ncbi:serine/threonine-protein phosphatase [candidate division KSB1 bacterium]|nr:serine/threonine-protein phosphatase [candidate division KSB1 bacterium]
MKNNAKQLAYQARDNEDEGHLHFSDFRRTFSREWNELKEHLLSEDRKKRLPQMTGFQRFWRIPFWLLKALFQKLNRFRRILLIVSFVLLFQEIRYSSSAEHINISLNSQYLGFFLLLFILMLELKDKLLARHELEAGRAVQKALMPEQNPKVPGWAIWLYSRSANDVGGDLLDYYAISPQRNGIALGDVSDKGLGAALLMANLQATLRALAPDHPGLEQLGKKVNHIFYQEGLAKNFASLIYLEISAHSGRVRWINAGHLPPNLVRQRRIIELSKGEAALGLGANTDYTEQTVDLLPGDILVLYSDGLTDARNNEGAFFGEERMHTILIDSSLLKPDQIGASLLHHIDRFIDDAPVHDDLTLAIIQRVE